MPLHATNPQVKRSALLVLEDGRTFRGESFGAEGETFGEAVFSTGMTGYQETLTDPSYHRQVVIMTAPHVGNTGVKMPFKWTVSWLNGKSIFEIESVQPNVPIDNARFARPAPPK